MILDIDSATKLGPIGIESDLNSLTIGDNAAKTLTQYDLRKFEKLSEYKLSGAVSSLKLTDVGLTLFVSDGGKVIVSKVIDDTIKSLAEFTPKAKLTSRDQLIHVIKDVEPSITHCSFLMLSRNDLIELVEVNIT